MRVVLTLALLILASAKALEWYEKALTLLEQDVELRKAVANTYKSVSYDLHNKKKYAECRQLLNRAIELDPTFALAYSNRGSSYRDLKEYEQAIKDLVRAIELDPTFAKAYYERGRTYADSKGYERAIEDCHHAIELDPFDARAFLERGYTYVFLKEFKQALQDFGRAIELDPTIHKAYSGRGITYLHLEEHVLALQDFGQAIKRDPKKIRNAWLNIWTQMCKQRIAIETAEDLVKIAVYSGYVCQGVALGLCGRLKEGLEILEQTTSLVTLWSWDHYFWKGMLSAYYYPGGKYHASEEAIAKALDEGMPTILLKPLYWLDKDRPDFFEKYARQLLEKYGV